VAAYPHLAALYTIGATRAANQLLAIRLATVPCSYCPEKQAVNFLKKLMPQITVIYLRVYV